MRRLQGCGTPVIEVKNVEYILKLNTIRMNYAIIVLRLNVQLFCFAQREQPELY
jgi:hypothetical protein